MVQGYFILDQEGHLQRVTDVGKLANGQAVWTKTQIMTFADYFYNEDFFQQHITSAGLNIDKIENYYTEKRRITYNSTNPDVKSDICQIFACQN